MEPSSNPTGWTLFAKEARSILYLSLLAALILMSYAFARGPSEAIFLSAYGSQSHLLLPGLWIEIGLSVILLVALYNYLLRFFSLNTLFNFAFIGTAGSLALLTFFSVEPAVQSEIEGPGILRLGGIDFPIGQPALLRIWSDLYIVVLVEIFWSLANLHFPLKKATRIYGLLCAGGTLGSIAGNSIVALKLFPTHQTIQWVMVIMLIMIGLNLLLDRHWKKEAQLKSHSETRSIDSSTPSLKDSTDNSQPKSSLWQGLQLIIKSRSLTWILGLVLLSQITVSLIDYEYKSILSSIGDQEIISSYQGWMYLSIDIGALLAQLATGVVIGSLGIGGTLLSIPLILGFLLIGSMIWPTLLLMAMTRSSSKFLTYSIFKSAKELLYVPLSYQEQTQGKAVIDIMVYRQAKVFTSFLLLPSLGLIVLGTKYLTLLALCFWCGIAWRIIQVSRQSQSENE